MRTPVFELHIHPMFRAIDRDHMLFAVDLWDYDAVKSNANEILARLETDMPPEDAGGPWPGEWVEVFRRWTTTGFRRLQLGTAEYTLSTSGTVTTLIATGTFPAAGFRGWFDIESVTETAKTYVLWFEPPEAPAEGSAETFRLRERYRADNRPVFVHDSTGVNQVR